MLVRSDGTHQILEGSIYSIGGLTQKLDKTFEESVIENVVPGDMFYLFTDGFMDQFGGPDDRKFTAKRLHRELLEKSTLDAQEQKAALEQRLSQWQQGQKQTDDILLLGIRV